MLSVFCLFCFLIFSCQVEHSIEQQPEEQKTKTTKTEQIDDNTQKITDEETISKEQERDATKIEILRSGGKIPWKWVWTTYYRWTTWYYSYGGPWWKGKQLHDKKTVTTIYYTDGTSSKSDMGYVLQWIKTWNSSGALTSDTDYTDPKNVTLKSLFINGGKDKIFKGETTAFIVKGNFSPSGASASLKNISWASSNPSIATVNNGVVTGKKKGTTTIKVSASHDGVTKTETKPIYVHEVSVSATLKNGAAVYKGDSYTSGLLAKELDYTVSPIYTAPAVPNPNLWKFVPASASGNIRFSSGVGSQTIYVRKKINDGYWINGNHVDVFVVDKDWNSTITLDFSSAGKLVEIINFAKKLKTIKKSLEIFKKNKNDNSTDTLADNLSLKVSRKITKKVQDYKVKEWHDYNVDQSLNLGKISTPKLTILGIRYVAEVNLTASLTFDVSLKVNSSGYKEDALKGLMLNAGCSSTVSGAVTAEAARGYFVSVTGKLEGSISTGMEIPLDSTAGSYSSTVNNADIKAVGEVSALSGIYVYRYEWTLWSKNVGSTGIKEIKK